MIIFALNAQNYSSTINFIVTKCPKNSFLTLYLNGQEIGIVRENENFEYKLYSEGRLTLYVKEGIYIVKQEIIDIEKNKTYYYELRSITGVNDKYEMINEEKGKGLISLTQKTIKAVEDKQNPLVKGSIKDDENTPKQGTCFLVSREGYLITNYHVIEGAKSVKIKGIGNDFSTLYGVDVIAYDIDLDLALLKTKNINLKFDSIPYNISGETNSQGTKSFTLGYPLTSSMGEEIKVTEGIISAKSGFKGSVSQYQFSAAVQPGNSGSPLFNDNGDVIGIINAKLKESEGVGYAIKSQYISTFLRIVDSKKFEENKTLTHNFSLSEKVERYKNFIYVVFSE